MAELAVLYVQEHGCSDGSLRMIAWLQQEFEIDAERFGCVGFVLNFDPAVRTVAVQSDFGGVVEVGFIEAHGTGPCCG